MLQNKKEIKEKFEAFVKEKGFFLIELVVRGDKRNYILELFIDNEEGVTTDNCADVSRELINLIDENELIDSKYRLDVSSPGVERPLVFIEQFPKHINRQFEIKYTLNDENQKLKGKLLAVEGTMLKLEQNKKEVLVDFDKVTSAKVLISF